MLKNIQIKPLTSNDFTTMHNWFNQPHVQAFYSLRAWTQDEVVKKLMPYLESTSSVKGFIMFSDEKPIAYLQYCDLSYNPWPDQDFSETVTANGVGIDFLIGDPMLIGNGLSHQIIDAFLAKLIWAHYQYCVADPDIRNIRSIKTLEKCGFSIHKQIATTDTLGHPVTLQLMIKER